MNAPGIREWFQSSGPRPRSVNHWTYAAGKGGASQKTGNAHTSIAAELVALLCRGYDDSS